MCVHKWWRSLQWLFVDRWLTLLCPFALLLLNFSTLFPPPSHHTHIFWRSFISSLRVFLVDVISLTRTNCTQPMTYYASMVVVLVGLKVVLMVLLVGPWAWGKLLRTKCKPFQRLRDRQLRSRMSALEDGMRGRRRRSVIQVLQSQMGSIRQATGRVNWMKVFRSSFMLLFVAYPGVALKVWACVCACVFFVVVCVRVRGYNCNPSAQRVTG